MHNSHISGNGLIILLRLFHIQLRPRMTRLTARGIYNISVKNRRTFRISKAKRTGMLRPATQSTRQTQDYKQAVIMNIIVHSDN